MKNETDFSFFIRPSFMTIENLQSMCSIVYKTIENA